MKVTFIPLRGKMHNTHCNIETSNLKFYSFGCCAIYTSGDATKQKERGFNFISFYYKTPTASHSLIKLFPQRNRLQSIVLEAGGRRQDIKSMGF
jgi:hypothetical protein